MRRVFRPGETVTIAGELADPEADTIIPGVPVELQLRNIKTGKYETLMSTTSDGAGAYSFSLKLPDEEGSVPLRTYFPGNDQFAPDASPAFTLQVKKPKAARTVVSVEVS